ncbi:uncharacterized protein H6S33_011337 [Morchella sextelata]|uniref:uncharacterized protein n=1 Tax=Morchella sextelata TaxID=1174677 RepID=UPI001D056D18|nr:uncharacterized protein H6S33_011337 [Morchella sextelata]KAH0610910.1 hypothetical protein H6S33_011337 [Morchella sextelata]
MSSESFEGLFDRLRRQSTMSPQHGEVPLNQVRQQQPSPLQQQQQQQQQQQYQQHPQQIHGIYPPSAPSVNSLPPAQQYLRQSEPVGSPGPHQQPSGMSAYQQPQQQQPQRTYTMSSDNLGNTQTPPPFPLPPYANPMSPPSFESGNAEPITASPPPRPSVVSPPPISHQQPSNSRNHSASDLMASLRRSATEPSHSPNIRQDQLPPEMQHSQSMRKSTPGPDDMSALAATMEGGNGSTDPAIMNNRPSPSSRFATTRSPITPDGRPMSVPPAVPPKSPEANVNSMPFSTPNPSKGLFTYVNPFEQLHATSPRNRTPRGSTPVPGGRKSAAGLRELKAENIPLPSSSTNSLGEPSPNAAIEAEAAKDASTLDQALEKEELMEKIDDMLDQQAENRSATPAEKQSTPLEHTLKSLGLEDLVQSAPTQPQETQPQETQPQEEQPTEKAPAPKGAAEEEDDYESASETASADSPVIVYNFPMKPFSSITIIPAAIQRLKFPSSKIADIARMPRTFDQLDRNLIAASHQFIVYAISKSNGRGGIRVLRQYDGKDKVLMKDCPDRTFNVTISRGDRVLGTGISGAVVWAELGGDFEGLDWNCMFVFPPSEEQGQSNGVLKSRARRTSRQLDVFAIGRGKTISIIHAPTAKAYANGKRGFEVASKKYLADHTRVIDTGKASKDFAFSDDDTVIISIDKAGKLKLWDAQDLTNFSDNAAYSSGQSVFPPQPPMVQTNPLLYFSAVATGEAYRATSVMFLDKFRPYHKCSALRYVIVGMKQNHTLQLWDLALSRPVQEINFPQESDTDALCSVVYHPVTGIIVVGNPTRNSIYFIHLSAPKYNLPFMSQAQYVAGLAAKDPNIPKPDATAILSGLREYSFASKGQLMSLDILDASEADPQGEVPPLFELYIAHSKGMTTLSVFREDLGWDTKNSVKNSVDAVKAGICSLSALPAPPPPEHSEKSTSEKDSKSEKGTEPEKVEPTEPPAAQGLKSVPSVPENVAADVPLPKSEAVSPVLSPKAPGTAEEKPPVINGSVKKKRKDKGNAGGPSGAASGDVSRNVSTSVRSPPPGENENLAVSSAFLDREIKKIEKTVSSEFSKVMSRELETLYRRFDEDKRVQQAAGDAKQDAILRLLSSTLTENVEQVIGRIVMNNIQGTVLPAIADVTSQAIDRRLGESLTRSVGNAVPAELHAVIPDVLRRTLSQPEFLARLAETIAKPLSKAVENELSRSMQTAIIPAFQQIAIEGAQNIIKEQERKHHEMIANMERIHQQDSQKIDQLMGLVDVVKTMSDNIQAMAKSQNEFQEQVQRAQAEYVQAYEGGTNGEQDVHAHARVPTPPPPQLSPEELEAQEIENLLRNGKYEEGTIKWLQSKERQAELFDEVVVRYRYDFLPNLSQLVLLSVSAAVSVKFENKVFERLSWLEGVLAVLDPMDPEIHEICHRIMAVVVQRLEQLYMSTAEQNMADPILRRIPAIARRARELSSLAA